MLSVPLKDFPIWFVSPPLSFRISEWGFPGNSIGKEPACNEEDLGSIPGLRRSLEGVHGNAFQYSWLENPHGQRSLADYSP